MKSLNLAKVSWIPPTPLKSDISTTTQPFDDLNSGGCCPRCVDEGDIRNNKFDPWLAHNPPRGVHFFSSIYKSYEVLRSIALEPNRRDELIAA